MILRVLLAWGVLSIISGVLFSRCMTRLAYQSADQLDLYRRYEGQ